MWQLQDKDDYDDVEKKEEGKEEDDDDNDENNGSEEDDDADDDDDDEEQLGSEYTLIAAVASTYAHTNSYVAFRCQ